jgi:4-hydroxy-tetrahydrodipicolinate synthase
MKKLPFGFWPVMITAFSSDNRLDLDGVRKLTDMYMQAGANGLFANCLSSEMFQLSNDERLKLTGTVVEHCNGAIPVVATGTFSRNCRENSEFIRKLHGQGAMAVVLISSVLVDPGEDDDVLKGRIEEIMENTGEIPLGLYECPEPYERQISAEMMAWLAGTGRFWYHKDTSCDAGIISSKLDNIRGSQFQLYNADTPSALASLRVGAKGISPISGNFYPELYSHCFHKLLTGFSVVSPAGFEGIVESDDLFFLHSEKGKRHLDRKPRQRGGKAGKPGISNEQVAVIATCDRSGHKDFKVATQGRVSKKDIEKVLKGKLDKAEVLCSDSHRSYTAFAKDIQVEHKKFNASKGQRKADKIYHVQNVNNMDKRLRAFMQPFNGVATKYLQNYLHWFHFLKLYQQGEDKQLKSLNTQLTVMDKVTHAFYPYSAKLFLQKRGLPIGTTSRILNGKMSTKDLNILEALFQMHECLMEDYNLNSIV